MTPNSIPMLNQTVARNVSYLLPSTNHPGKRVMKSGCNTMSSFVMQATIQYLTQEKKEKQLTIKCLCLERAMSPNVSKVKVIS